jgi:hypothetical protein
MSETIEELSYLIEVAPDSPTGARWAVNFKRHTKGSVLGYLTSCKKYWRQKINNKQYAVQNLIWVKLHDSIPKDKTVDHIDNNGLNNNINNLRLANSLEQLQNRRSWSKAKFRGVNKQKNYESYCAYCMYPKYGRVHLGYYKYAEHAAIAHDIAAIILFPENTHYKLNYPEAFWLNESTSISEKVLEKLNAFFESRV